MESLSENNLFPVFLKLDKLKVLIIGGGSVAEEKLHFMLKSSNNAHITIIAPCISERITSITEHRSYPTFINQREILKSDIKVFDLIIAATNQSEVNRRVYSWAKEYKKIVNVADTPELCDFYMGSIVTRGDLKIAISTNGKSPTFAKRFRQVLEAILPNETNDLLQNLKLIRDKLEGSFDAKVRKLNSITEILIKK